MKLIARLVIFAVFASAGAVGAWVSCARWLPLELPGPDNRVLPGLRIDGQLVGGDDLTTVVEARAGALGQRRVRLIVPDLPPIEATLADLGVTVDENEVSARALRLGRAGDPFSRALVADHARRGQIDVPLEPAVDPRALMDRLLPMKEDVDAPSVAARLDLEHHEVVDERDGRALDLDGAVDRVSRAAVDPSIAEIELPFVAVHPTVTRASLARIDITKVLSSFETGFSRMGDQGPRARNIEVAASHLDGLVIEPGESVSFNAVVGPRSEDNGFKHAFEILKGEMVEGTGGGTCQVASTLHAIAFFGGLDVLQRLPHSRPSGYIPAGLDATVVYPVVDLKLRNPFSFPVVVHTVVTANKVKMELLGADKPANVTFGRFVVGTTPFGRKVVEDGAVSKPKRKQKGIDGMELVRTRVLVYQDGTRKEEHGRDVYPPTQEIWHVPPGFEESTLPPLGMDMPKPEATKPQAQL